MAWRRFIGTTAMFVGCSMVVAMFILAGIIVINFITWNNAIDALRTVATITLPAVVFGAALILVGRLTYGGWNRRAPLRRIAGQVVQVIGVLTVAALGAMLLVLIITGVGPQDRSDAASLGLGVMAGLAIVLVGVLIQPRIGGRSYGKD